MLAGTRCRYSQPAAGALCGAAAVQQAMRRLYLMRHGETLYLGRQAPDGFDLTPEGRAQLAAAAALLRDLPIDLVCTSPMRRATGTAQIVVEGKGLEIEVDGDLREIAPGTLDGMDAKDVFGQIVRFFSAPDVTWDTPFLGGETFRQVRRRVLGFVERLLGRPGWERALVVAHGGANSALLAGLLGLEGGPIPPLEQDLGCINIIDFDGAGRPLVRLVNFSAHDPLKVTLVEPSVEHLRLILARLGEGV